MHNFKKYYKFPLKPMEGLELVKVLTDDNKMAFDWCTDYISSEVKIKLIDQINTGINYNLINCDKYNCGYVYLGFPDIPLIHIRGWGMLTDHPYHLSKEEAKLIQDEFGKFICKQLNI